MKTFLSPRGLYAGRDRLSSRIRERGPVTDLRKTLDSLDLTTATETLRDIRKTVVPWSLVHYWEESYNPDYVLCLFLGATGWKITKSETHKKKKKKTVRGTLERRRVQTFTKRKKKFTTMSPEFIGNRILPKTFLLRIQSRFH